MSEFWQRLQQRKLVQWVLAYVAGAWAVLQVIGLAADSYHWPDMIMHLAFGVIALGFIVTLVLAWYHGERGEQRVTGVELLLLASVFAIGGFLIWHYAGTGQYTGGTPATPAPAGTSVLAAHGSAPPASVTAASAIPAKSIAVLPFENLSEDKANEYFASGMQDMILTRLAGIRDLKVISRTSTEKYASHPDDLKVIGRQLGVATILEGSVQKAGNSVLINVQLIDADSDAHLWAEAYPRTLENIFGVEGEVAQKVADALKAQLTATETASVARVPTQNAAAYDWFLKGDFEREAARKSWQEATFDAADADYRQAIEKDSGFALAYAMLAYNQLNRHWFSKRLSVQEMESVKSSIDRALALAPDLPEAHLALGYYYYWGFRRYDEAVPEFQRTLQLAPNNTDAISGLAFVARRTRRVPQALAYLEQALKLSPRDAAVNASLGETYAMLRRYDDADRYLKRSLEIAPADANSLDLRFLIRLIGFGDVKGARDVYRNPPDWRISGANRRAGDVLFLVNLRATADLFERRFADALHDWDSAPTGTEEERQAGRMARVVISIIAGNGKSAQADCARLQPVLDAELGKQPDSLSLLQQLSWVEVCLGHKARALAAAQKTVELRPVSKDSYWGGLQVSGLAQVAAHVGEADRALELIRQLLAMPFGTLMSVERLRLDPVWDPLRKDPRFQALLKADGSKSGASQ